MIPSALSHTDVKIRVESRIQTLLSLRREWFRKVLPLRGPEQNHVSMYARSFGFLPTRVALLGSSSRSSRNPIRLPVRSGVLMQHLGQIRGGSHSIRLTGLASDFLMTVSLGWSLTPPHPVKCTLLQLFYSSSWLGGQKCLSTFGFYSILIL